MLWGRTRCPQQVRLRTALGKAPGQHWPFSLVFLALHFGWCFPQLAPRLLLEGGAFVPVSGKAQYVQELGSQILAGPSLPSKSWDSVEAAGWNRNTEFLVAHPLGEGRLGLLTLTEDADVSREKKRKCNEKEELKGKYKTWGKEIRKGTMNKFG